MAEYIPLHHYVLNHCLLILNNKLRNKQATLHIIIQRCLLQQHMSGICVTPDSWTKK